MGRKRKLHLGSTPIGGAAVKSRRLAREITSKYHVIQNEKALIEKETDLSDKAKRQKLSALEEQMTELGGTNRYQQASIISTQHFKTSKWVASTLEKLGRHDKSTKLNVLEVGAINVQLQQYNWMKVRAIDLNSQHPQIEEQDFFGVEPTQQYDVAVCSMVVNCVDNPIRRGEMLARLSCQLVPETGILFLVLPSRCINSKHVGGINMMTSLLAGLGLRHVLPVRQTPKLIFFILGISTEKKKKHTQEGAEARAPVQDSNEDIQISNQGSVKMQRTQTETDSTRAGVFNWKIHVRTQLAATLKAGTLKHFTQDFSNVPPNEFAVQLSDDLVSLCS